MVVHPTVHVWGIDDEEPYDRQERVLANVVARVDDREDDKRL